MTNFDLRNLAEELYFSEWTVEDVRESGAIDLGLTADETEEVAVLLERLKKTDLDLNRLAEELYFNDWTVEYLMDFGAFDLGLTADEAEEVAVLLERLSVE